MRKKVTVFNRVLTFATIFFVAASFQSVFGGGGDPPASNWYLVEIPMTDKDKNGGEQIQSMEGMISYAGKVVYTDRIVHHDFPIPDGKALDVDLILRSIDDPTTVEETAQIFGHILGTGGHYPREDLRWIAIASLENYHGKLFVGVRAEDNDENGDKAGGTDDTFRRRVFVTASVAHGELISNAVNIPGLSNANLLVLDRILPQQPHGEGEPYLPIDWTSAKVQIRTHHTELGLYMQEFVGPDGTSDTYFDASVNAVAIPAYTDWFQYKVIMDTLDERLTPVFEGICLKNGLFTVFSETSWANGDDYSSTDGISGSLSPGELVLENKWITPQISDPLDPDFGSNPDELHVKFVEYFQAPSEVHPPPWCSDLQYGGPGRNFSDDNWLYPTVVSMKHFQDKLYLNIGVYDGAGGQMTAGEFATYDYGSGVIKTIGRQYSTLPRDWWSEGNGTFDPLGKDLLVVNGVDTKGRTFAEGEVAEGEQLYYIFDGDVHPEIGNGDYSLGLTPVGMWAHLWCILGFSGKVFISRNRGCYYRDMPATLEGHYDQEARNFNSWTPLEGTGHKPGAPGHAESALVVYGGHLVVLFDDLNPDHIYKVMVFDETLNLVFIGDFPAEGSDLHRGAGRAILTHKGRLLRWNQRSGYPEQIDGFGGSGGGDPEIGVYDPGFWACRLYYTDPVLQ